MMSATEVDGPITAMSAAEVQEFFDSLDREDRLHAAREDFLQRAIKLVGVMSENAEKEEELHRFMASLWKATEANATARAFEHSAAMVKDMPKRAAAFTVASAQSMSSAAQHLGEALALSAKSVMQSASESAKSAWNALAQTVSSWFSKSVNLFRKAKDSLVEVDKKFDDWMDAKIDAGIDAAVLAAKSLKTTLQIHGGALMDVTTQASVMAIESLGKKVDAHIVQPVVALANDAKDAVVQKKEDAAILARSAAQAALQSVASKAQSVTDVAEFAFRAARQSTIRKVDAAHAVVASGLTAVSAGLAATASSYQGAVESRRAAAVAAGMAAIATSNPDMVSVAAAPAQADMLQSAARVEPAFDVAMAQGASQAQAVVASVFHGYTAQIVERALNAPAPGAEKPSVEQAEVIAEDEADAYFGPSPMMG
jgi:hypothetical protein